jgi:hypothetical protein
MPSSCSLHTQPSGIPGMPGMSGATSVIISALDPDSCLILNPEMVFVDTLPYNSFDFFVAVIDIQFIC